MYVHGVNEVEVKTMEEAFEVIYMLYLIVS